MNTQFGLVNLWDQGDLITQGLVVLLLVMSLWSWIVIVIKTLDLRKFAAQARATERFWRATDLADGLNQLGADPSNPFRALALEGREATAHHNAQSRLHDSLDGSEWLTRSLRNSIDASTARLQSGLAVLASVGSTAPFVGLLGTVWGIYHALTAIGISGQASIDKVAGPVGEALIMTAIGLAVAIPAVLAYNWLARRNKAVMDEVREFADELNAVIVGSAGKAA
jgi:biopolymer transport protein ExbB